MTASLPPAPCSLLAFGVAADLVDGVDLVDVGLLAVGCFLLVAGVRMVLGWKRSVGRVGTVRILKDGRWVRTPWGWVREDGIEGFLKKKGFVKGAKSQLTLRIRDKG